MNLKKLSSAALEGQVAVPGKGLEGTSSLPAILISEPCAKGDVSFFLEILTETRIYNDSHNSYISPYNKLPPQLSDIKHLFPCCFFGSGIRKNFN
jgi:hypothetical protein